jgi:hypothetical protein
VDGGLPHRRVPQDLDVERGEQQGLKTRRQVRQASGQLGQLVQQVGVSPVVGVAGQVRELPVDGLVFGVQVGEVGVDAGAHGVRGLIRRVGGQPA